MLDKKVQMLKENILTMWLMQKSSRKIMKFFNFMGRLEGLKADPAL